MIYQPAPLKKGDTIAMVCPSGFLPFEKAKKAISVLESLGYQVKVGKTVGHQHHYFSGTDEERLDDLQTMLDDQNVKAILCGRGGYGMSRIVHQLNFKKFKQTPKWIIGFSDITVLHCKLFTQHNTSSIHASMAAAFNNGGYKKKNVQSLLEMLKGKKQTYIHKPHAFNQHGKASGLLVGGNLSLLAHLSGTKLQPQTNGAILFIEDVGEYIYNIDRMLLQLEYAGWFKNLSAIIVGGFTEIKDTQIPFGKSVTEVIRERISHLNIPISYQFPISHGKDNWAVKIGANYELNVNQHQVTLKEI